MQARKRLRVLLLPMAVLLAGLATQVANATHPRPSGATPLRVSLVPAYEPCSTPNGTHPELGAACLPPGPESDYLTVGSPDANGQPAKSNGSAVWKVKVGVPGPPEDSDVLIDIDISDVRKASDLSDYTGQLTAAADVRVTDHRAVPSGGGSSAGTVPDTIVVFGYLEFSCSGTADPTVGGTCTASTSANAIFPSGGIIADGKRTIVQKLYQIRIGDGGADGIASTSPNTGFMTEGIFIP